MNTKIHKLYQRLRWAGYHAKHALSAARSVAEFQEMEGRGLVRLRAEQETENYFDVYGEPEGYVNSFGRKISAEQERKEMVAAWERDGIWCCLSEYSTDGGETWELADSVGMCDGYKDPLSPFQNCYVPDLMRAALDQLQANWTADLCGEH